MCFPGGETQITEAMYTRHSIRVYLLSTSLYFHLLQLFSCHPLKEHYKKISILCSIRNNSGGSSEFELSDTTQGILHITTRSVAE